MSMRKSEKTRKKIKFKNDGREFYPFAKRKWAGLASEACALSCLCVAFRVHRENNLGKEGPVDMWVLQSNARQKPEI
jgi:hypothetical protein